MIVTLAGWIKRALPGAFIASVAAFGFATASAVASNSMSVQPDGRIVLAGATSAGRVGGQPLVMPALVRLNPDGTLDSGFGGRGSLIDFRGSPSQALSGVVATSSHSIFTVNGFGSRYRVARFESDGDVDSNFGVEGSAESASDPSALGTFTPSAILPLADGTIVIGGSELTNTHTGTFGSTFADTLHSDGTLASTTGKVTGSNTGGPGTPIQSDLVRTANGDLVMVGSVLGGSLGTRGFISRLNGSSYEITEGLEAGLFPGKNLSERAEGNALAAAGDGFVAAGSWRGALLLARFTSALDPEETFGEAGIVNAQVPGARESTAEAVAVQPDGRIVVAGGLREACENPSSGGDGCWRIFLTRFEPDGKLDVSFGTDGYARLQFPGDDSIPPIGVDVAPLPDGSILVSDTPRSGASTFQVARFSPSGALDGSFGQAGVANTSPCPGTVSEKRKSGCLSHAYANFHADGLAKGRPHGGVRLNSDNLLDPMESVSIILPPQLRGNPKLSKRLRVVPVPRSKVRKQVKHGKLTASFEKGARGVSIGFRPRILRRVKPVKPGHKLVFVVVTTFKDRTNQRTPVRLAP